MMIRVRPFWKNLFPAWAGTGPSKQPSPVLDTDSESQAVQVLPHGSWDSAGGTVQCPGPANEGTHKIGKASEMMTISDPFT